MALVSLLGVNSCRSAPTPAPSPDPPAPVQKPFAPPAVASTPPALVIQPTQDVAPGKVAITFDDLGVSRQSSDRDMSLAILRSLVSAEAPRAVFANCKELNPETLRLWQRAGATIGNHTETHLSLESIDPANQQARLEWQKDVKSCDDTLRKLLGHSIRYFRHPYLRYGATEAQKRLGDDLLRSLRHRSRHRGDL